MGEDLGGKLDLRAFAIANGFMDEVNFYSERLFPQRAKA
jgi:hypothetical protein